MPDLTAPRARWFPGHTVAIVATLALAASAPGQTFVVSLFNSSLTAELGIEPLGLNTAYTLATLAAALPLTLTGKLTDRLGPRRTLALVAVAFGLGCAAMASAVGTITVSPDSSWSASSAKARSPWSPTTRWRCGSTGGSAGCTR